MSFKSSHRSKSSPLSLPPRYNTSAVTVVVVVSGLSEMWARTRSIIGTRTSAHPTRNASWTLDACQKVGGFPSASTQIGCCFPSNSVPFTIRNTLSGPSLSKIVARRTLSCGYTTLSGPSCARCSWFPAQRVPATTGFCNARQPYSVARPEAVYLSSIGFTQ